MRIFVSDIHKVDSDVLKQILAAVSEELDNRHVQKAREFSDSIAKAIQEALDEKFVVALKVTNPIGETERLYINSKCASLEVEAY